MREDSPPVEERTTYGTLTHLTRKTGQVISVFPVDALQCTIGRAYDCDLRIYLPRASKLHASINIDEESGSATLTVHGTHGVIYTGANGVTKELLPPTAVTLADGDQVQICKKLFRFSYGAGQTMPGYMSPAPKQMPGTPGRSDATPSRRRASMRLSIVPHGKRFCPSPAKARALASTPVKSTLSHEIEPEEPPREFEELVDVMDGDEGDKVYLERKDEDEESEEPVPIFHHPFMTPQPAKKAEPRNTSAVPRTRVIQFALPVKPVESHMQEEESEEEEEVEEGNGAMPMTPTSIPLPTPSDTPYDAPKTPSPAVSPMVTARVAYSTPRGSDSLRKALLLRSARKTWETTRPAGIEGEIQNGHVETRRRRSSGPRKSLPLPPKSDSSSGASDDESQSSDKENSPQKLQWVYENGLGEVSQMEDSDSDRESDTSIPGQGVIDFQVAIPDLSGSEESDSYGEGEQESDDTVDGEDGADLEEEYINWDGDESPMSEGEVAVSEDDAPMPSDIDDEVDSSKVVDPEDVARSPSPVVSRFYTPQPVRRQQLGGPRTSLAGIGGALDFSPKEAVDVPTGTRIAPTPGRLGKPQRFQTPAKAEEDGEDEQGVEQESFDGIDPSMVLFKTLETSSTPVPATPKPVLSKAQRDALGTPRELPLPPLSFRATPARAAATPLAKQALSPEGTEAVSRTPYDDIKRRLSAIRLSVQGSAKKRASEAAPTRRATVGFSLPETPSRQPVASSSFSVGGANRLRIGAIPATPRVDSIDEGESESLPPTPTASAENAQAPMLAGAEAESAETPKRHTRRRSILSESFDGLRNMLKTPKTPKSPSVAGVREMFKTPKVQKTPELDGVRELMRKPKEAKTPSFIGLRNLLREPEPEVSPSLHGVREMFQEQRVPPTPAFNGMREMFAQPVVPATPALDGAADLYAHEEASDSEEDGEAGAVVQGNSEDEAEEPVETSAPSSPEKPTTTGTRTRSRLPTRPTRASASSKSSKPAAEPVSEPVRATRSRKPVTQDKPSTRSAPVRRGAAKKDDPPSSRSEPVRRRTRGTASAEPEEPAPVRATRSKTTEEPESDSSKPARSTRSRSAADSVEPEARATRSKPDAASEPAPRSRSRKVLGEAEQATSSIPTRTVRKKASTNLAPSADEKSAPSRRTRSADKENSADVEIVVEVPRTRRTAAKESAVPVPVARATRSRKAA